MHRISPFRARKGDAGFTPTQIPASKCDDGFRQPAHLVDRARQRQGLAGLRDDAPNQTTATQPHWRGGRRRVRRAWLRCPWAVAGLGRASRRRAEPDNSDPAPLVRRAPEGPEGTGGLRGAAPNEVRTPSLAGGRALRRPEHPWGHKQHKTARPHRGRAAQAVSVVHRRITMISGSPRPLSWRTLEIPSLAATSFAVPSMRGSS